jgi:hypothetical protein
MTDLETVGLLDVRLLKRPLGVQAEVLCGGCCRLSAAAAAQGGWLDVALFAELPCSFLLAFETSFVREAHIIIILPLLSMLSFESRIPTRKSQSSTAANDAVLYVLYD